MSWRHLYGMAGVTVAPALVYVAGALPPPDPANPNPIHFAAVPAMVDVSPSYHQGTATYNPHLGHMLGYNGGAIT